MILRSIQLVRLVQEVVPPVLIPVFVFITYLGSPGVLPAVLVFWYWLDGRDRSRSAFALAMSLCGYGLALALKGLFMLPRPPSRFHLITVSGYGFPSGHAIESTIVYATLALVLSVGTRRRRATGAMVMIGLVALSRVVLGVHYPADVVGGIVAGGLFLAGAIQLTKCNPSRGFCLAGAIALVAFLVGDRPSSIVTLGISVGGALAWWWLNASSRSKPSRTRLGVVSVCIIVFAGANMIVGGSMQLVFRGFGTVLAFMGIIALPTLVRRMRARFQDRPPSLLK